MKYGNILFIAAVFLLAGCKSHMQTVQENEQTDQRSEERNDSVSKGTIGSQHTGIFQSEDSNESVVEFVTVIDSSKAGAYRHTVIHGAYKSRRKKAEAQIYAGFRRDSTLTYSTNKKQSVTSKKTKKRHVTPAKVAKKNSSIFHSWKFWLSMFGAFVFLDLLFEWHIFRNTYKLIKKIKLPWAR